MIRAQEDLEGRDGSLEPWGIPGQALMDWAYVTARAACAQRLVELLRQTETQRARDVTSSASAA